MNDPNVNPAHAVPPVAAVHASAGEGGGTTSKPSPSAVGTLLQKPVAHLLIYARGRALDGSLELRSPEGGRATLTFVRGKIAKAETTDPVTFLGRVLFELGSIDESILASTLAELAVTKRLHGSLLLERGDITSAQLHEGLRALRDRKVLHAFAFPAESTFAFYNHVDLVPDRPHDVEPSDGLPLVWQALRERPLSAAARATLGRLEGYAMRVAHGTDLRPLGLREDERDLAECLRLKALSLGELVAAGFLPPTTTEVLVYFLMITKAVELVERSDADPRVAPSTPPPRPASSAPPSFRAAAFGSGQYATNVSFTLSSPPVATRDARESHGGSEAPVDLSSPPESVGAPSTPPPASTARPSADVRAPSTSPPVAPASESARDAARRRVILERASQLDRDDFFKVLRLDRGASAADVQTAFNQLAVMVQPDQLPASLVDLRKDCARILARASAARDTLVDPRSRRAYEESLSARVHEAAEADAAFAQAEMNAIVGDYPKAEQSCRKALALAWNGAHPDASALLAWLEAQDPRRTSEQHTRGKIVALDLLIAQSPSARRVHYYRATLHKRVANHEAAIADLRRAVHDDPDDQDAMRELRAYEKKLADGSLRLGAARRSTSGLFEKLRRK